MAADGNEEERPLLSAARLRLEAALAEGGGLPVDDQLSVQIRRHIKSELFGQDSDPLCKWLFEWYQSGGDTQRQFVAQFLPEVVCLFVLRPPRAPALPGLNALMVVIFEDEDARRASVSLPQLHDSSVYHTPNDPQTYTPPEEPPALPYPPGVAALMPKTSPAELMPKRIEGAIQQWQVPEVAAAAFYVFLKWAPDLDSAALVSCCRAVYTIASHACSWAAAEASPRQLDPLVPPDSWHGIADVRVPINGSLLLTLCLAIGHCHYRQVRGATDGAVDLLEMARTAACVLHARTSSDLQSKDAVLTSALMRALEDRSLLG